jgi:hypothetical protein
MLMTDAGETRSDTTQLLSIIISMIRRTRLSRKFVACMKTIPVTP